MKYQVLVVEPDTGFAELISEMLPDDSQFVIQSIETGRESLLHAAQNLPDLVIVDTLISDMKLSDLIVGMRVRNPILPVMLIPAFGSELPVVAKGLDIQGVLPKPFFPPDLENLLHTALKAQVGDKTSELKLSASTAKVMPPAQMPEDTPKADVDLEPAPEWLQNRDRAAQYLIQLSLESGATATMLTRGTQRYAYAGQFSKEEADTITTMVYDYWKRNENNQRGNLMRIFTLNGNEEYMLNVTKVTDGVLLSMIFDANTPFGEVRRQSRKVIDGLTKPPTSGGDTGGSASKSQPDTSDVYTPTEDVAARMPDLSVAPETAQQPVEAKVSTDVMEPPMQDVAEIVEPEAVVAPMTTADMSIADEPVKGTNPLDLGLQRQVYRTPHGLYTLTYTFVWLPKRPDVELKGDVVDHVQKWVNNLALAYDWRVEQLDVQAKFVQLVIACSPGDAPEQVIKVMMDKTSETILKDFPRHQDTHLAGRFWAPGYLVQTPGRLLSAKDIDAYIRYQRNEQGLTL